MNIVLYLAYFVFTLSGLFLFKANSASVSFLFDVNKFSLQIPCFALLGILFYICSFILWLAIIKRSAISFAFPILNGLIVIFTVIGGIVIFREKINTQQVLGAMLIVIGIIVMYKFK